MFSHRLDFSRRFQKSIPKMADLAFVRKSNSINVLVSQNDLRILMKFG
jgi:hypothetical protein